MTVELHAFSGLTGAHVARLGWSALSWSDSINEPGSLTATVEGASAIDGRALRCYGSILAAVSGGRVLHAGYVTGVSLDPARDSAQATCGGFATVLEKRLVLNRALRSGWRDGEVVIDEENPPGSWVLTLRGTYRDIVRGLVAETLAWGRLPVDLPAADGGGAHERTYNCWELATVADRIGDIGDLEDGPEVRFDPYLADDGSLRFLLRVEDEVRDAHWRWSALAPGQGVAPGSETRDGAYMCTQSFATGGRDEDVLLVARASGGALEAEGWPVLQVANTSHTTVSELPTLLGYVRADVAAGDDGQECRQASAPLDVPVRVGDWADVQGAAGTFEGKVTDVSGDASSGRLAVSMRARR